MKLAACISFMADLRTLEAGIAKKLGRLCHTAFMDILSDGYVIAHLKTSFQLLFIQKQQLYSAPEYWEQTPGDR